MDWCLQGGDGQEALRLAACLLWFWVVRGLFVEGRRWLERALLAGDSVTTTARAQALYAASMIEYWFTGFERLLGYARECGELARKINDESMLAWALAAEGIAQHNLENVGQSVALHEESVRIFSKLEDRWGLVNSLRSLGAVHSIRGDFARAGPLLEESLRLAREQGERANIGWVLNDLGRNLLVEGRDLHRAMELADESRVVSAQLGDRPGECESLRLRAQLHKRLGSYYRGKQCIVEALGIVREMGTEQGVAFYLFYLAGAENEHCRSARAARLLGAAAVIRKKYVFIPPHNRREFGRIEADVRAAMGDDAFKASWDKGWAMPTEEAIDYALSEGGDSRMVTIRLCVHR